MHFVQKPKCNPTGKNRSLSTTKEPEYVAEEGLEILEAVEEAAEDEDEMQESNMAMMVDDDSGGHTDCQVEASVTRHTGSVRPCCLIVM